VIAVKDRMGEIAAGSGKGAGRAEGAGRKMGNSVPLRIRYVEKLAANSSTKGRSSAPAKIPEV